VVVKEVVDAADLKLARAFFVCVVHVGVCGLVYVSWCMWVGVCGLVYVGWCMWVGACELVYVSWCTACP
jgi:hypothetical protein